MASHPLHPPRVRRLRLEVAGMTRNRSLADHLVGARVIDIQVVEPFVRTSEASLAAYALAHPHAQPDVFDRWAAGELDPTSEPPRNQYEAASRINDPKRWQQ